MIGFALGLGFLSSGGTPVTGGSVTVPDAPHPDEEPVETGGTDTGTSDTGTGDTGGSDTGTGDTGTDNTATDTGTGDTDTGAGDTDPPATVPDLPLMAAARWHPEFSTVTLDGDRVLTASDLQGLANLTGAPGTGPRAMVDGLGRKFWRFEGDGYLTVANALALSSREMALFMVGRFHRISTKCAIFSLGSQAAGTANNSNGAALSVARFSQSVPLLKTFSRPTNTAYPTPQKMVTGSQMQVVGMVGRTNASGGSSLWLNEGRVTAPQPLSRVAIPGAEIGRYSHSPGASGDWGGFDLYEMIAYDTRLTDTEGDTLIAGLMATYGVVPTTNQLVLEGDSIMQGTGAVLPALSAGMVLTDPGDPQLGADWRVINLASSGSKVSNLATRRDTTLGWPDLKLAGQNVLAFEIGRNDISISGGETPASHYANVVAYLTDDFGTEPSSILAKGWDLRVMANIASSPNYVEAITAYRALLREPAFAVDLGSDASGAYTGQMQLIETDLITDGGQTVFATPEDAADQTYYAGDSTHPGILGAQLRATGGDNPSKGIAAGL